MKEDFKSFDVGTVFNPLRNQNYKKTPELEEIAINYPARLNAMAIDPSKIATNENLVYTPGEVIFPIQIYKKISANILPKEKGLIISERSKRKPLIEHAYKLMQDAIGFEQGMYIDVDNSTEIKHVGLGSSSSLISGVASAINELYGNQISPQLLVRYLAQNHGEEIDNDNTQIMPVQCIGGSAAGGIIGGGLIILCGESVAIKTMKINNNYDVVIGIPSDFHPPDSKEALEKEIENIEGFIQTGKKFGKQIAYNILHKGLPAMVEEDLSVMGDIIFDYRYNMGSIKNCSFLYPKLIDITNNLKFLKEKKYADVLSISSVGPGLFAITQNKNIVEQAFKDQGLTTVLTKIENKGYKVLKKVAEKKFWNDPKNIELFVNRDYDKVVIRELTELLKSKKNIVGFDLGCGGGRHSELMVENNLDLYGVDLNEGMIATTKKRISHKYSGSELEKRIKQSNMLSLPFQDNFVDFLVCTGVLHQARNLQEYKTAINELSRVMKKGAIAVTNIFSNTVMDNSYQKVNNEGCVLTKEGLYMTLLSKEEYLNLMNDANLIVKGEIIEDIKNLATGPRAVLRAAFTKK